MVSLGRIRRTHVQIKLTSSSNVASPSQTVITHEAAKKRSGGHTYVIDMDNCVAHQQYTRKAAIAPKIEWVVDSCGVFDRVVLGWLFKQDSQHHCLLPVGYGRDGEI